LVALFWILLFSPAAGRAVNLFSFGYNGKILAFAVANSDPVAATVKDSARERATAKKFLPRDFERLSWNYQRFPEIG
jgi:hypothetical protein